MANKYGHKTGIAYVEAANSTVLFGRSVYVREIRWVGAVAAGDDVVITDGNGEPVFESKATVQYDRDRVELNRIVADLKISTLDSGKVYIYLDEPAHR